MSAVIIPEREGMHAQAAFAARPRPLSLAPKRSKSILILVEPRPFMRECLSRLLQASARNFRIVAASDPAEVADIGTRSGGADLVLINIGGMAVTDAAVDKTIGLARRALPETAIAVLSDREDSDDVAEALRRGVRGYIPTSLRLSAVIEALRFIRAGGTFVPASAVLQPVRPEGTADDRRPSGDADVRDAGGFTARELEVLALLRRGQSNKRIAYELNMQESTLKVHVRNIKRKLGVTNRTQAALRAHELFENHAPASDPEHHAP